MHFSSQICLFPFFVISCTHLIGDPLQNTIENKIIKKTKENKFNSAKEIRIESQWLITYDSKVKL